MKYFFIGIFLSLFSIFLLEYNIVGQAVYGDGRYYWAITRSLYFEQNIDISDEMSHYYSPESNSKEAVFTTVAELSGKTKEVTHAFSLGVSLVWIPLYLLADGVTVVLQSVGVPVVRNGYSDLYQIVVGLGNILFVITGLVILSSVLKRFFSQRVVVLTILLLLFATNLLYYAGLDVINSHPLGFLLVTLLVWSYIKYGEKKDRIFLLLQALIVGLLMSNRTQDGIFLLFPLFSVLLSEKAKLMNVSKNWLFFLKKYFGIFLFVFIGYLPQLMILSAGQGHLFFLPHTGQAFTYPKYVFGILFDTKLGISFYMPVFFMGVAGLFFLKKKLRFTNYLFLSVIFLHFMLIASWEGWHQAAYTMRYFVSLLPLIAFGIAEGVQVLLRRYSKAFVYALVVIFIFHQLVMIVSFKLFLQDPTNVGSELSRSGKLKLQILQQIDRATKNLPLR